MLSGAEGLGGGAPSPEQVKRALASPAGQILSGVGQAAQKMVPSSVGEAARMFTYSPLWDIPAQAREAYDDLSNGPVLNAPPTGPYAGFTQKPA